MKELIVGGYCLEAVMRQGLARAMAERLAVARSGWTRSFGPIGRGMRDVGLVRMLAGPHGGEDPWQEVGALLDGYAAMVLEVFEQLDVTYPSAVEEGVRARLSGMRGR